MKIFPTPRIIKQAYHGFDCYDIADDMLSRREIICSSDITAETADSLILQLLYLAHEDPIKEITLYINSPGGEVSSGLALYDVMRATSCPIHTICVGMAASMAAVLFAAGNVRDILPHAFVMIHDPLRNNISGSALSVRTESEQLMYTREVLCGILAEHTGRDIDEIYDKTREDTYFYGREAVDFGLADHVITSLMVHEEPRRKTPAQKEASI